MKKNAQFSIRMPEATRRKIEAMALKENRSLANAILCLLEHSLSAKSRLETKNDALHQQ